MPGCSPTSSSTPKKKGRSYSKGNRQKVALVAALARPAKLYIFDEPTSGLDPVMESVFSREVERVQKDGSTVLLSSHILSEVERLCDRVTIVRAGKAVETGTLSRHAAPHAHELPRGDGRESSAERAGNCRVCMTRARRPIRSSSMPTRMP